MDYEELARQFLNIRRQYNRPHSYDKVSEGQRGEMLALNMLANHDGPLIPRELSELMGLTSARIATILNALEDKNFIIRKPDNEDRRRIQVLLTEEGRTAYLNNQKQIEEKIAHMLQLIGPDDAKEFVRINAKLAKKYDEYQKEEFRG